MNHHMATGQDSRTFILEGLSLTVGTRSSTCVGFTLCPFAAVNKAGFANGGRLIQVG